jgi:hypothetical protein
MIQRLDDSSSKTRGEMTTLVSRALSQRLYVDCDECMIEYRK